MRGNDRSYLRPGAADRIFSRVLGALVRIGVVRGHFYVLEVQRFFPVPKGSPVEAFGDVAPNYPVFELKPLEEGRAAPQ